MSFRSELDEFTKDKHISVRAYNCLCRSLSRIKDYAKPVVVQISELTDDEIIGMRNVGQKTFQEIKSLVEPAKKEAHKLNIKEYIIGYHDDDCRVTRADTQEGLYMVEEYHSWYKENKRLCYSGRQTIPDGNGSYMMRTWAENAAEAFLNFALILKEEGSVRIK